MTGIDLIQRIKNLPLELMVIIFNYYEASTKYGIIKTLYGHHGCIYSLAVLPDGTLASVSEDKSIKIWDIKTGDCIKTLRGHYDWIRSLALLKDGTLASGSDDETIKIWDVKSGECLVTLGDNDYRVTLLVGLTDGSLVSLCNDNTIRLWNTNWKIYPTN